MYLYIYIHIYRYIETVTSLPDRPCPEQGLFFVCSPGLCPWSYIYIYTRTLSAEVKTYNRVLGVMYT